MSTRLERVRWGIVATGGIAAQMARDLGDAPDAVRYAVASRSLERADAFAEQHGFARAYGSYEELLADPDVDAVYVATPHRQHLAVAKRAVVAGKPLLIEKAFTVTLAGAIELLDLARERDVFVMEGMWTRFLPLVRRVVELVRDGAIGEVRSVTADLGFVRPYAPTDRLWDPEQGGGAMLDLGVYPASFAQMILGDAANVRASGRVGQAGVDTEIGLLVEHEAGTRSTIEASMVSMLPGRAMIVGDAGWVDLPPRLHHPELAVVHRTGAEPQELRAEGELATTGHGFAHEVHEVHRCLRAGLVQSDVMPWADTLAVMRIMEAALHQVGVRHTEDGAP